MGLALLRVALGGLFTKSSATGSQPLWLVAHRCADDGFPFGSP